jgi:hypothetical protein
MSRGLRDPAPDHKRELAAQLATVERVTAGVVEEWAARAKRWPACSRVHRTWLKLAERYWEVTLLAHFHLHNTFSGLAIAKAARLLREALSAQAEVMPPGVPIHEEPLETIE